MSARLHALAGTIGLVTIAVFWIGTVAAELAGDPAAIAAVKRGILWGLLLLVPAMAAVGASGVRLARGRSGPRLAAKRRRMPVIAANALILVPCAVVLDARAAAGVFDSWFFGVQALELAAGAGNLALMGLNLRDGLRVTGRLGVRRARPVGS
jgi:hypothetical protein